MLCDLIICLLSMVAKNNSDNLYPKNVSRCIKLTLSVVCVQHIELPPSVCIFMRLSVLPGQTWLARSL